MNLKLSGPIYRNHGDTLDHIGTIPRCSLVDKAVSTPQLHRALQVRVTSIPNNKKRLLASRLEKYGLWVYAVEPQD